MILIIKQLLSLILLIPANDNYIQIPYNFSNPEIKIELSKELEEISGLSWHNGQLVAIQDEAGIVYFLNAKTGEIKNKIRFSLPGDFEGIEVVGNEFYCLTSSGTIFQFNINSPENVTRIKTPLTWKNDAEGLAYDKKKNRLLIACKEQAGLGSQDLKGKAIYSLDLEKKSVSTDPIVVIRKKEVKKFVDTDKFKPSGLAFDPLTGNLYLLASSGKLLIVLNSKFEILSVAKLPSKMYPQPEGICFSPNGDLFISNEGGKEKAIIYCLTRIQ